MLTTLKEVLARAREGQYCVGAFDVVEDVMTRAVLETAERLRAPVILMLLEPDLETDNDNGWVYQAGLIKAAAKHHRIPIVMHLDHANDLGLILRALDWGFTSVMIDGSQLPFDENVALTKAAVDLAGPYRASVEGELGHVGGMDLADKERAENVLTEPDEVKRFVEQTGVDALAVSIGTAHGVYQAEPALDIERLKQLNDASPVPLALHGGSGTPNNQVRDAVRNGICKLNIYTDERLALFRGVQKAAKIERNDPLPRDVFGTIKGELADMVEEKIKLLFSVGKAW